MFTIGFIIYIYAMYLTKLRYGKKIPGPITGYNIKSGVDRGKNTRLTLDSSGDLLTEDRDRSGATYQIIEFDPAVDGETLKENNKIFKLDTTGPTSTGVQKLGKYGILRISSGRVPGANSDTKFLGTETLMLSENPKIRIEIETSRYREAVQEDKLTTVAGVSVFLFILLFFVIYPLYLYTFFSGYLFHYVIIMTFGPFAIWYYFMILSYKWEWKYSSFYGSPEDRKEEKDDTLHYRCYTCKQKNNNIYYCRKKLLEKCKKLDNENSNEYFNKSIKHKNKYFYGLLFTTFLFLVLFSVSIAQRVKAIENFLNSPNYQRLDGIAGVTKSKGNYGSSTYRDPNQYQGSSRHSTPRT